MKVKKINLLRLNEIQLDKKQQQLIFGGQSCKCGSCGSTATSDDNLNANYNGGITDTGTNSPYCGCDSNATVDAGRYVSNLLKNLPNCIMKQVLCIILFFVFSIAVNHAQTNSAKKEKDIVMPYNSNLKYMNPMPPYARDVSKTTTIDSGFIRVLYALNAVDIKDLETYDDLQRLEIGAQYSKYYSLFVFDKDSTTTFELIERSAQNNVRYDLSLGDVVIMMIIDGKYQGWSEYLFSEYFKNFSTNELTEYTRMPCSLDKYNAQYSEPLPVQHWEISDDTLTVAGYLCQKATCRFRGRDYTAWFSNDIPINNGPWKFGGLPGLILKVYDKDKLCTFECVGMENHKQKYPVTLLNSLKQYNKMDRMKLWKLKKSVQENYYHLSGSTPKNGRAFPKLYPYNPLELE
ncbi:hypothetical protein AGMMS50239_40950 [Bacteroidia bacterium]|nr:hypothetical protein AGMMS50239_40950 [Bacteroidia bacterium]